MTGMEVVAKDLHYPEGPVVLAEGVAFVETGKGQVTLCGDHDVELFAVTGGGPNGLAVGADGCVYVAQNGVPNGITHDVPPGVQRITPDRTVSFVPHGPPSPDSSGPLGPNDLAFGPDARLFVSDPNRGQPGGIGRLLAFDGSGLDVIIAKPDAQINGVGFDREQRLLWSDSAAKRLMVRTHDHDHELFADLPEDHIPDGFALADDGRIALAGYSSHAITIISPEGDILDLMRLDSEALPTNCCFEGSTLWVTDYASADGDVTLGRLWRLETDMRGAPLHRGAL